MSIDRHGVSFSPQGVTERRSVNGGKRVPKSAIDALSEENQRLASENKSIKQCLKLTKENCQLQTLNYLSYAMSLNDSRLRNFLTDVITSVPTRSMLKDQSVPGNVTGKYQGSIPLPGNNKTTTFRKESRNTDNTYGHSFPEVHFSDIQSSYDENSVYETYGKSFPEVSMREFNDTYAATQTNRQTPKVPNLQWVSYDQSDQERSHCDNGTRSQSSRSVNQVRRSRSPSRNSKGRARSQSRERRPKSPNLYVTPGSHVSRTPPQTRHSPEFYDSLEANQTRYNQTGDPNQHSISHPPMRFGLNPNPMQQNPYTNVSDDRRESRTNKYKSTKQDSRSNNYSAPGIETQNRMRMSDLENTKGVSGFKQYTPIENKYYQDIQYDNDQQKNYDRRRGNDTRNNDTSNTMNNSKKNLGHQIEKQRFVSSDDHITFDPAKVACHTCRSPVPNMDQGATCTLQRSPICKHTVEHGDNFAAPRNNPELLVRVNTTFGRSDVNNYQQTMRFSDLYEVPNKMDSANRTEHTEHIQGKMVDQKPMTSKENAGIYRLNESSYRQSEWPHQSSLKDEYSRGNTLYPVTMSERTTTGSQYIQKQPAETYNYMTPTTESLRSQSSVLQQNQSTCQTKSTLRQPPAYTTPALTMNNYKTTFADDSLETVVPVPINDNIERFQRSEQYADTQRIDYGPSSSSYANNAYSSIGDPIAMSTPMSSDKQKRFLTEQQHNLPQISQLLYSRSDTCHETNKTNAYPPSTVTSYDDYFTHPPTSTYGRGIDQPIGTRCATAPPMNFKQRNDGTGMQIQRSNGAGSLSTETAPGPKLRLFDTLLKIDETEQDVSLADVVGIFGKGSDEKAKSYFYRPVDTLIGYTPSLTTNSYRLLQTTVTSKRIIGEIAFQLDRRLLEFVIAGNSSNENKKASFRYYGYSLTNIEQLIIKEANKNNEWNPRLELALRNRFSFVMKKLQPLSYIFDVHAEFTQDMVNKYGLLNISSDQSAIKKYGLLDIGMIRLKLCQLLMIQRELHHMMIIFDCLCFLAYHDGRPVFIC